MPSTFMELKKVLKIINKYNIKYYVIGNGSNIIFTNKIKECFIKLNFIKNKNVHILKKSLNSANSVSRLSMVRVTRLEPAHVSASS